MSSPINDSRREDSQRRQADELAETLSQEGSPYGLRALRLADRLLGLGSSAAPSRTEPEPSQPQPAPDDTPRPISIWQPRRLDGRWVFERPPVGPLGDHYAARRRFNLHKEKDALRVVFLGESVAAGYLYAPHWTPAQVLQQHLAARLGRLVEVIDLARTNERLPSLATTLDASRQLGADTTVVFAGNNWRLMETPEISPYAPSPRDRQAYAEVWLQAARQRNERHEGPELDAVAGFLAVNRWANRRLARRAEDALTPAAEGLGGRPLIWLLPESHLEGWHVLQPVPWLEGDRSRRWTAYFESALEHLEKEDWHGALADIDAMECLDGGLCATTPRLRSLASRKLGRVDEARRKAQEHIDASAYPYLGSLASPQTPSHVADLVRRLSKRLGWTLVDLPQHFAERSRLPGDDLFLDYCHLTAHGMNVAMGAATDAVVRALGLTEEAPAASKTSSSAAVPDALAPPAAAEALACVGAAVHGAHRHLAMGAEPWPLRRWLERAATADADALDLMEDLLEVRSAPGPEALTAAQGRQLERLHRLLPQHGWHWPWLDGDLLRALCDVLEAHGRGVRAKLRRRLLTHFGLGSTGKDLSRPPFLWQPLARLFPEVMDTDDAEDLSRRATVRCPWPWLDVALVSEAVEVHLEITARLPEVAGQPSEGTLQVELEGQTVGDIELTERWTTHALAVPASLLDDDARGALHRLRLRWPSLPEDGDAALQDAMERLELGRMADLHPIFGEVYRLRACTAPAQDHEIP